MRHGLTVAAMGLLIAVLLYMIMRELTTILRPLLIAVFVGYLIVPAHRWLVARKVPSILSYVLIVGAFVGVTYIVGSITARSIGQVSKELPEYARRLSDLVEERWEAVASALHLHREESDSVDVFATAAGDGSSEVADLPESDGSDTSDASQIPAGDLETATPPVSRKPFLLGLIKPEQVTTIGQSVLNTFLGVFTGGLVVLFYLIFLMAEQASLPRRLESAFGAVRARKAMDVVHSINGAISRYIAVKTLVSLLVAAVSFAILFAFGVRYALLWAVLTFFANFIPYIGSMVAVILPIGMSFVQFGASPKPFFLLVLLFIAQSGIGSVLEPRLVGQKLGVSPLIILLSLAFWGFLWGIPGMILCAPLAVTIKIVLENIEQTRPVARLCSNI